MKVFKRKLCISILLCFCMTNILYAQEDISQKKVEQRKIKGIVLDAKTQEPLIGANVSDEQKKKGATTDAEGRFTLTVDENCKNLEVSFLGYKTLQVKLGERTVLKIMLDENSELLDEVVVTGTSIPLV